MKRLTLNVNLVKYFSTTRSLILLHKLAHAVVITAGVGRMDKQTFLQRWSESSGYSVKTLYRAFKELKDLGFWHENDGRVYMVSKKKALKGLRQEHCRLHIKFDKELLSYKEFRNHCISQVGLYHQKSFRHAHKRLVKNMDCPLLVQRIPYPISLDRRKVGVATRFLAEKMGISRATIMEAFRGKTKLNFENIDKISLSDLQRLNKENFFKENVRIKAKPLGNRVYQLMYNLPSTLVCEDRLGRDGRGYVKGTGFNSSSKIMEHHYRT